MVEAFALRRAVVEEAAALDQLLAGLTDVQLASPTNFEDWTVEEIAAREVFLERWTAHTVAAAINADPAVRELVENGEARPIAVGELEPHAFDVLVSDVEA